jgi:hypothetical protein
MSREVPKKKERQKHQGVLCVLLHVGRKLKEFFVIVARRVCVLVYAVCLLPWHVPCRFI